jgi:hypothetical protein
MHDEGAMEGPSSPANSTVNRKVLLVQKGFFILMMWAFGSLTIIALCLQVYWWLYFGEWAPITLETVLNMLGLAPDNNPHSWWNHPSKWIGIHKIVRSVVEIGLAAPLWLWTVVLWMWAENNIDKLDYELKFGGPRRRRKPWDQR